MKGKIEYEINEAKLLVLLPKEYTVVTISNLLDLKSEIIRVKPKRIEIDGAKVEIISDFSDELLSLEKWSKENGVTEFHCINFSKSLKRIYDLFAQRFPQ